MHTKSLKGKVATACRILGYLGLADHLGHVSARIPGTDKILIKAKASPTVTSLLNTTPAEIVTIDLKGSLLEGRKGLEPPGEAPLHTCIYERRSDVGSVTHVHSQYATAFAIAGKPILPVFEPSRSSVVVDSIPVFNNMDLINTIKLGSSLAKTLGTHKACLLRWHGLVAVGRTVEEATVTTIFIEEQAKMNLWALRLGPISSAPRKSVKQRTSEGFLTDWAYYEGLLPEA